MNRNEIIFNLKKYFHIKDLVCNHVFSKFGELAWDFLQTEYLHTILVLRTEILNKPMICNNYLSAQYQRGLRCNMCNIVSSKKTAYMTAHIQGNAGDFTVYGYTAEQTRNIIVAQKDKLPYNIRLEGGVNWLHVDTRNYTTNKVVIFKP